MEEFDVVIIGGGTVGASLALALSNSDLTIALVDQKMLSPNFIEPGSMFSPKVSALTEASINLLKNLHVWDGMIAQRLCIYHRMKVWDREGTGAVDFKSHSAGGGTLGCISENNVISNALLARLKKTKVTLFESQTDLKFELDNQQGQVILTDGTVIDGRLLVAADGAESPLKIAANIQTSQKNYLHHALVTTVETEHHHQDTAWQVFLDTGPLAFLPLPTIAQKHYCAIVWSLVPEQAEHIMALDDSQFCHQLRNAFERRLGNILHAEPRFCLPLQQRHAQNYYRNNIVLVGDAAHTIHPLAGQGLNLGLMDVAVLTEEILRAERRQDNIAGSHILARYQRRRKGHNLLVMSAMTGFQNLFSENNIAVRWLRNTGLKTINQLPFIKEALAQQALGTTGELPELAKRNL